MNSDISDITPNTFSTLVLSTLLWCPSSQIQRSQIIINHLAGLAAACENYRIQTNVYPVVLVVDNDTENEAVRQYALELCSSNGWIYKRFTPQLGWARGRNYAMEYFMSGEHTPAHRLILTDCDQLFTTDDWLSKITSLCISDPDLNAYMIRPDKENKNKTVRLESGTIVDIYQEWLGTTNVLSAAAINTIGGYDHQSFPATWGFHDADYGRRLRKSGLLDVSHGYYIDPVRTPGIHGDSTDYNTHLNTMKQTVIRKYNQQFVSHEAAINNGTSPLFFPYICNPDNPDNPDNQKCAAL